jgi:signal transduction histidine kinase
MSFPLELSVRKTLGTAAAVVVGPQDGPMSTLGLTSHRPWCGYRSAMGEDRRVTWRDALVPLLVFAVAALEAVSYGAPRLPVVLLLELLACTVLVPRRRWTGLGAVASFLLVLSLSRVGPAVDELASPVLIIVLAAFSLGRWTRDLRGLAVLAALYVLMTLLAERADGSPTDITDVVFVAAIVLPPYIFGRVMRTLDERSARLAEQAELLARLQATVREDAIAAERARIARELHDVLAHSISAMVVQATAGEELVQVDPERAATAMRSVADTGRRALAETGRLLSLVRDTEGEMGIEPDPGLGRLGELVEQFRRSGLDVALEVSGELEHLPAGVDLSAYRIVQEALTNALKYAPDRCARVQVRRVAHELRIEVENRGRRGPSTGSGLGLIGMGERVSVYGGSLEHAFTRDGRFVLTAVLPLETAEV